MEKKLNSGNKIIALKGKESLGKTETIHMVFRKLEEKYPQAKVEHFAPDTEIDIKVIMDIGETKVGIESQGDPKHRLGGSLSEFYAAHCNIIICATRTRGMTVQWVEEYSDQYEIEYIDQSYDTSPTTQPETNNKTAECIISKAGL